MSSLLQPIHAGVLGYRYLVKSLSIVCFAFTITLGLFFLMQSLIHDKTDESIQKIPRVKIEFTRTKRDTQVIEKKPELPKKDWIDRPQRTSSLNNNLTPTSNTSGGIDMDAPSIPSIDPDIDRRNLGRLHEGSSGGGIVPLVRIQPIYPRIAQEKRIEGWVLIEFSIGLTGAVEQPKVIDAKPSGFFEQSALEAVRKWKYKPTIKNGIPVITRGLMVKVTFNLSEFEDF